MTTRNLLSDDGNAQTFAVLDDNAKRIGTDVQPSPGTPSANQGAIGAWLDGLITQGENAVANWASLTPAQKDNAAKQVVQAVTRLARLVRNNLSSSGT